MFQYSNVPVLPIHVEAHSGHKGDQQPRRFVLDDEIYEIASVLDEWYEPNAMFFKVRSTEGKAHLLRYDGLADECDLAEWLR